MIDNNTMTTTNTTERNGVVELVGGCWKCGQYSRVKNQFEENIHDTMTMKEGGNGIG
jgi:hypothetical protein